MGTRLFLPSLILYLVAFLFMFVILLLNLKMEEKGSTSNIFFYFAVFFCLCRSCWFILLENSFFSFPNDQLPHVLNRMCWTSFLCALFVILLCWYSVLSRKSLSIEPASFLSGTRRLFCGVMGPFFLWAIVDSVYYAYFRPEGDKEDSPVYNAFIMLFSVSNLCLSLAAVAIGGKLILLALQSANLTHNSSRGRIQLGAVRKLTLLAALVSASFALRCIIFMYRPITNNTLDANVFICLAYLVPELLPLSMQSTLFALRIHKAWKKKKFKALLAGSAYTSLGDGTKSDFSFTPGSSVPLRQSQAN